MERDERDSGDYVRDHRLHGMSYRRGEIRLLQRHVQHSQVCFGEGVRDLRRLSVDGMLPDGRGRFAARARCEDKPPFGRAPVRQGKGSYLNIQV